MTFASFAVKKAEVTMIYFRSDHAPEGPKTWVDRLRDVRTSFSNLPRAFRLVWEASPSATLGMALVTLLTAFVPASQAWIGKLIVDAVVRAINDKLPAAVGLQTVL